MHLRGKNKTPTSSLILEAIKIEVVGISFKFYKFKRIWLDETCYGGLAYLLNKLKCIAFFSDM